MISDGKLKLKSGKEVEIKVITRHMARQIKGYAYKAFVSNPEYIMLMSVDTVMLATGLKEAEVEKEYTDAEIDELADLISGQIDLTNEQKKR